MSDITVLSNTCNKSEQLVWTACQTSLYYQTHAIIVNSWYGLHGRHHCTFKLSTVVSILFKYTNTYFFAVLFWTSSVLRHCASTRKCQTPRNTPHHTVPRQQQRLTSPWSSVSPDQFRANRRQRGRVGRTCWRQSERPYKRASVVPGTPVRVSGHPSAGDSHRDPVHA